MVKVALDIKKYAPFGIPELSVAWINKNPTTDEWELLYVPTTCRTYLNCYWARSNLDPNYDLYITPIPAKKGNSKIPNKEQTTIFYSIGYHEEKPTPVLETQNKLAFEECLSNLKDNLPILNAWEVENGLKETTYLVADDPTGVLGVIFIGDSAWGEELWKITIFSFLTKLAMYTKKFSSLSTKGMDNLYWDKLKAEKNFKPLMSKVKTFHGEILAHPTYHYVHNASGFFSILSGDNPTMHKLLFSKEKEQK